MSFEPQPIQPPNSPSNTILSAVPTHVEITFLAAIYPSIFTTAQLASCVPSIASVEPLKSMTLNLADGNLWWVNDRCSSVAAKWNCSRVAEYRRRLVAMDRCCKGNERWGWRMDMCWVPWRMITIHRRGMVGPQRGSWTKGRKGSWSSWSYDRGRRRWESSRVHSCYVQHLMRYNCGLHNCRGLASSGSIDYIALIPGSTITSLPLGQAQVAKLMAAAATVDSVI